MPADKSSTTARHTGTSDLAYLSKHNDSHDVNMMELTSVNYQPPTKGIQSRTCI